MKFLGCGRPEVWAPCAVLVKQGFHGSWETRGGEVTRPVWPSAWEMGRWAAERVRELHSIRVQGAPPEGRPAGLGQPSIPTGVCHWVEFL